MPGIDESRAFIPLNIAVLTVSDTRQLGDDRSGDTLVDRLTKAGHALADRAIVTDDVEEIRARVRGGSRATTLTRSSRREARLHRPRRDAGSHRAVV